MLTFYGFKAKGPVRVEPDSDALPKSVSWIDAFDPTPEERERLRRLIGARVPTLEDLLEIETSSRLSAEDDVLFISFPAVIKDEAGYPVSTPVGFVVTPDRVATIRFAHLPSFEHLAGKICDKGELTAGGLGATVHLVEIIIDHIADLLERVGGDLDGMSRAIFSNGLMNAKNRRPHRSNLLLTDLMHKIGRFGDLVSKISETLLGLSRMAPFLSTKAEKQLTPELKGRLEAITADTKSLHEFQEHLAKAHAKPSPELKGRLDTVSTDLHSLHEFQEHLANKTQFLLDALLGLTNIEQNNVFRVLTVVSVVGIPPTFVASMYGMNFKNMPELEWHYGYAYGLAMILLSALVPAIWFKVKGWW